MVLLVAIAVAHHDTAVNPVGVRNAGLDALSGRHQLSLGWGLSHFGRARNGSTAVTRPGTLTVQTLALSATTRTESGWMVGVTLPLGTVSGGKQTRIGLGDLTWTGGLQRPGGFVTVDVSLPTGAYAASTDLQFSDAAVTDQGVRITTYDTRANLGRGTVGVLPTAGLRTQSGRWVGTVEGFADLSPGRTRDGIVWGPRVGSRAHVSAQLGRLRWQGGLVFEHRFASRSPAVDDVTGAPYTAVSGRRSSLGSAHQLLWRLTDGQALTSQVHVPIWQHTQGTQLVESVSVGVGYQIGLGT